MRSGELADRPADVVVSQPERLGKGYCEYQRYRLILRGDDPEPEAQTRDVLRAGRVVAVLPIDLARGELVLIRQFRLAAHLANGSGDLVETVAGRVDDGETPAAAARRECTEEIGVAPTALVELFSFLTTPGIAVEEVTLFAAAIDASRVPERTAATEGERIATLRVPIDAALAALAQGRMRNGPLLIALQWLALNRGRLAGLLTPP